LCSTGTAKPSARTCGSAKSTSGPSPFNTAVRRGSLHTIIGGGVDSGGPVRVAATAVKDLLDDEESVRVQRKAKADPTTLLPIGAKDDFIEPAEIERRLAAEATELCAAAARDGRPRAVIEGGEAVVAVPSDHGVGGRNQQTVLAAVEAWWCAGEPWPAGLAVASLGTDGEDGPTDAAGGIADDNVVQRLSDAGIDVARAVARCDAYPVLAAAGGLIRTGPTGTNVADVRIILARP
jgi:hypothetical protein